MKGLWAIIITIVCGNGLPLLGYIYEDKPKVLRKWHPEHKKYHYWIGFCDFHDKTNPANFTQRKKIEELLQEANPEQILILVEDLSSPNDNGRLGCGSYFINSRFGILAGLGSFCKSKHIPCKNVEYRYCRVVALGPVINNISVNPNSFPSTKKMAVSQLMQEIEHIYTDLLLHNQTDQFKELFLEKSRMITKTMEKLNLMSDRAKSVADYLTAHSTAVNRLDRVKKLLTFDGILIGFKLVSATMKASNKEKIIAFAGGTHINEAYELLQKIDGYEPVHAQEQSDNKKNSVVRSIGTNVFEGGLHSKPPAMSLELLEHYLKN